VWVVAEPPSALFLLARFDEAPGEGCEERLFAHARGLGANRLYIDRAKPCAGAAYMVRGAGAERGGAANGPRRGLHAGALSTADMVGWVRARLKVPASISAAEAAHLCAIVQFEVSPMRRIWNVRGEPIQSSGNPSFDEAVRAALESAIDEHATVPAPPADFVGEYVEYRVEIGGSAEGCRAARR
jgi:hypothetical protein